MVGAIGISKRGVDYDAFDGGPVRLAFLILSPRHNADLHLKTLKLLAEALDLPGFTEALMSAADSAAAHEVIRRFEELLGSA
jgi:PTS system fructose-specific IIC component/PTS system nitrogen regulatory IIA component